MSTIARPLFPAKTAGWRETAVLVVTAWLVPVLVHLIPWGGARPLGVYVMPVFWTTFLAVYFYGAALGAAIGLVTPAVNLLLTGLPGLAAIGPMSLEVGCFAVAAALLVRRWPGFRLAAPLAWVIGKGIAVAVQYVVPAFGGNENPFQHLLHSTSNGVAGLVVLAIINTLLTAFYPKTEAGEQA
jgi:hypothetical protein